MKTKTCKRNDCKFFHLIGTKKDEPSSSQNGDEGSNSNRNSQNFSNNFSRNGNNQVKQKTAQQQVFQETRQPWEIAIEKWQLKWKK